MIEVHIFIPVADNDGRAFSKADDAFFHRRLARLFGGFSVPSGLVTGGWVQGRTYYADQSRVFTIALSSITQGGLVGKAVAFAKTLYRQERIYVRYLGNSEIL